ncbi:hypothetical protein ZWY2020_047646 [Hordeum vulgare]|nr:hypothetical protein ZWY2020_047646 [Hordeum vulgare]
MNLISKVFSADKMNHAKTQGGPRGLHTWRSGKGLGCYQGDPNGKDAVSLRQSIIRGHGMYNFLVRVLTVMSMLDSKVAFEQGNCVKFFMATEFCEFSPEIEDHFEIFEKPSEGST